MTEGLIENCKWIKVKNNVRLHKCSTKPSRISPRPFVLFFKNILFRVTIKERFQISMMAVPAFVNNKTLSVFVLLFFGGDFITSPSLPFLFNILHCGWSNYFMEDFFHLEFTDFHSPKTCKIRAFTSRKVGGHLIAPKTTSANAASASP